MPVYEYECPSCQSKFEVTRKFRETGVGTCPTCGVEGRRIYCAPFLVFKGPGFYVTESRTEKDPELEHRKKEKEAAEKATAEPQAKPAETASEKNTKADKPETKEAKATTKTSD